MGSHPSTPSNNADSVHSEEVGGTKAPRFTNLQKVEQVMLLRAYESYFPPGHQMLPIFDASIIGACKKTWIRLVGKSGKTMLKSKFRELNRGTATIFYDYFYSTLFRIAPWLEQQNFLEMNISQKATILLGGVKKCLGVLDAHQKSQNKNEIVGKVKQLTAQTQLSTHAYGAVTHSFMQTLEIILVSSEFNRVKTSFVHLFSYLLNIVVPCSVDLCLKHHISNQNSVQYSEFAHNNHEQKEGIDRSRLGFSAILNRSSDEALDILSNLEAEMPPHVLADVLSLGVGCENVDLILKENKDLWCRDDIERSATPNDQKGQTNKDFTSMRNNGKKLRSLLPERGTNHIDHEDDNNKSASNDTSNNVHDNNKNIHHNNNINNNNKNNHNDNRSTAKKGSAMEGHLLLDRLNQFRDFDDDSDDGSRIITIMDEFPEAPVVSRTVQYPLLPLRRKQSSYTSGSRQSRQILSPVPRASVTQSRSSVVPSSRGYSPSEGRPPLGKLSTRYGAATHQSTSTLRSAPPLKIPDRVSSARSSSSPVLSSSSLSSLNTTPVNMPRSIIGLPSLSGRSSMETTPYGTPLASPNNSGAKSRLEARPRSWQNASSRKGNTISPASFSYLSPSLSPSGPPSAAFRQFPSNRNAAAMSSSSTETSSGESSSEEMKDHPIIRKRVSKYKYVSRSIAREMRIKAAEEVTAALSVANPGMQTSRSLSISLVALHVTCGRGLAPDIFHVTKLKDLTDGSHRHGLDRKQRMRASKSKEVAMLTQLLPQGPVLTSYKKIRRSKGRRRKHRTKLRLEPEFSPSILDKLYMLASSRCKQNTNISLPLSVQHRSVLNNYIHLSYITGKAVTFEEFSSSWTQFLLAHFPKFAGITLQAWQRITATHELKYYMDGSRYLSCKTLEEFLGKQAPIITSKVQGDFLSLYLIKPRERTAKISGEQRTPDTKDLLPSDSVTKTESHV